MKKEKIILVTGANKGIGFEIARQLLALDHKVIMTARNESNGKKAMDALQVDGRKPIFAKLDVTNEEAIANIASMISRDFGKLDVLINNAGILEGNADTLHVTTEEMRKHLETNLIGPLKLSQRLIPLLEKSDEGRIINFSTSMARLSAPGSGTAAYRISKIALNGLTVCMAADLYGTNIKVNSMDPGWVKTDMGGGSAPRSLSEGADTAVWLATADKIGSGKFYRDRKELPW